MFTEAQVKKKLKAELSPAVYHIGICIHVGKFIGISSYSSSP